METSKLLSSRKWLYFQIVAPLILVGIWVSYSLLSPIDRNYTSGEMLDIAMAWPETGSLYPSLLDPPFRVLNYPPLFFLTVRFLHWIGLPYLAAGRLVNLCAFLGAMALAYAWLRKEGCGRLFAGAMLGLIGTAFPVVYSLGQFHLQLLALLPTLLGFYLLREPRRWAMPLASGIAFGLACWVKQTQVIFPLAALAWLLAYHRKQAGPFLFGLILTAAGGAFLMQWQFGADAWRHLVHYTVGTFSLENLGRQFLAHFLPRIGFVGLGFWLGFQFREKRRDLLWWYFIASNLWLFTSARVGGEWPYFVDWSFATILLIGPWLNQRFTPMPWLERILPFQIVMANAVILILVSINLHLLQEKTRSFHQICKNLPGSSSLISSEDPGIVRQCGHIPTHHPFIMANLAERRLWNPDLLVREYSAGKFPAILLPFDPWETLQGVHQERWTQSMIEAIRQNYQVVRRFGDWRLLAVK